MRCPPLDFGCSSRAMFFCDMFRSLAIPIHMVRVVAISVFRFGRWYGLYLIRWLVLCLFFLGCDRGVAVVRLRCIIPSGGLGWWLHFGGPMYG